MAKHWAKVHRNAPESERLADLFHRNPQAAAMYWPLKALADDFGRYSANPRKFAHYVGGVACISVDEARQMIADMVACGVVETYTVDGEELLQITDYHKHDDPNWMYVGGPEYPAPPGWVPPNSLVEFIIEKSDKQNVNCARYGITPGISAECDDLISRVNYGSTTVQPHRNYSSTTRQLHGNYTATDTDVDVDSDVDTETPTPSARVREAEQTPDTPDGLTDEEYRDRMDPAKQPNAGAACNVAASGLEMRVRQAVPAWSEDQWWRAQRFARELVKLRSDPQYPELTMDYIHAALETDPPHSTQRAESWLNHLKHGIREARTGSGTTTDDYTPEQRAQWHTDWLADMRKRAQAFAELHNGDRNSVRASLIGFDAQAADYMDAILEVLD